MRPTFFCHNYKILYTQHILVRNHLCWQCKFSSAGRGCFNCLVSCEASSEDLITSSFKKPQLKSLPVFTSWVTKFNSLLSESMNVRITDLNKVSCFGMAKLMIRRRFLPEIKISFLNHNTLNRDFPLT